MLDSKNVRELKRKIGDLEKRLKKETDFYTSLIENIPYPVFYKDDQGIYLGCNKAFAEFIGKPRDMIIGKTVREITTPDLAEEYYKADLELMQSKEKQVYETKVLHADGTYHDVIFKKTYFYSQELKEHFLLGFIVDVTEQKDYERRIERQNEEYIELNKKFQEKNDELNRINAELKESKEKAIENDRLKSVFLANMSHEIRTPMNGIMGFAELLRENDLLQEEKEKYLDIIKNRGNLLLKIINDIIDISKIDTKQAAISLNKIALNDVINDIYKFFYNKKNEENKTEVNFRVFKELPDGKDFISADSMKLQQVLTNILDNSFKFTQKGWVEFGYEVNGGIIKFFIKDTGKGISKENANIIFERFRQEDESLTRRFGGTGLGLTICKAYVELMGGKIWVDSEVGKGTSFYFTIPYVPVEEQEVAPQIEKEDIKVYNWSDKSILIVEDNYASYEYFRNILSKTNAKLYWVDNGRKAIEMFMVNSDIDLVLMDIQLPDVDGYFATKEIKGITEVPIIAQTANAFPEDEEKCKQAGCDGFITKPIDKKKLLSMIEDYFEEVNE